MIVIDGIIYSLQQHGGISVYFNELLSRLLRDSLDVSLITYETASENVEPFRILSSQQISRTLERYRRCKVPDNGQLFHSSYYRLPARKIPSVTTVHDFTYERFVSGARRLIHVSQKHNSIRDADAIICVSENTRQDLFSYLPDIDPNRVFLVHNGVGSSFKPIESFKVADKTESFVLFVGGRSSYKNFDLLVLAMSNFKHLSLVCVGGPPFSLAEKQLVQKYLLDRCVHIRNVTDCRLNELYNSAFCLAYPSQYEGFGIPPLEAMSSGCPVLAVNSSSIPEVVGNAAILLDFANVELIREGLVELADPSVREELRKAGFIQAKLFSWEKTYKNTLEIYKKVTAKDIFS